MLTYRVYGESVNSKGRGVMYSGVLEGIEPQPRHEVLPRHFPGRFSGPYGRAVLRTSLLSLFTSC